MYVLGRFRKHLLVYHVLRTTTTTVTTVLSSSLDGSRQRKQRLPRLATLKVGYCSTEYGRVHGTVNWVMLYHE